MIFTKRNSMVLVLCIPALLFFLVPILDMAQVVRPKDALDPKMYAQISGHPVDKLAERMEWSIGQISALRQAVEDLGHRLDTHRTELDALQPQVEAVKISRLEADVQAIKDEKAQREAERKADREAMMGWFRGIGSGVLVSVILVGFNAWMSHRREIVRFGQMKVLTKQTDGMTHEIARLSEAKGHSDERAGITDEGLKG
jgi:hypothetical protein